jgi:hypothetical protein
MATALLSAAMLAVEVAPVGAAKVLCTYTAPEGGVLNLDLGFDGLPAGQIACGGPGDDVVTELGGGIFYGNGGNDSVQNIDAGIFYGGGGNDLVLNDMLGTGTFHGGGGDDYVFYMAAADAAFYGNGGSDRLCALNWGTFDGGGGTDYVLAYNSDPAFATVKSVEITGSCPRP